MNVVKRTFSKASIIKILQRKTSFIRKEKYKTVSNQATVEE